MAGLFVSSFLMIFIIFTFILYIYILIPDYAIEKVHS